MLRYMIKADDDTYLHIPNLHAWMRRRKLDFSVQSVMFGARSATGVSIYHHGSLSGFTTHLVQEVIDQVSADGSAL